MPKNPCANTPFAVVDTRPASGARHRAAGIPPGRRPTIATRPHALLLMLVLVAVAAPLPPDHWTRLMPDEWRRCTGLLLLAGGTLRGVPNSGAATIGIRN